MLEAITCPANSHIIFADKKKIKLSRKNGQTVIVNLKRIIEEGHTEEDVVVQPDDQIYVPQRLVNF